jgi:CHAT domain-containing protein/tetratricopeptide (TPR) repeat protein
VLKGEDAKRAEALEKRIVELQRKGQFAESVAPARESLSVRLRVQGEDHWETASARITEKTCTRLAGLSRADQLDLARALRQQQEAERLHESGRFGEAEPLLRDSLEVYRRILGEEHPRTAEGYNDLAVVLDAQGKIAQAAPLYGKAMAIWRQGLGENHPETATSLNNVAYNLQQQGKHKDARALFDKVLAIRIQMLGPDHRDTAMSHNNLGWNLDSQGDHAEARTHLEKALDIWRRTLGEYHRDTAISYVNLALNLEAQEKYAEARPLFEKSLSIWRQTLGEEHPLTADAYNSLAVRLNAAGSYAEAETTIMAAVSSYEKARLRVSFSGIGRAEFASNHNSPLPLAAAVLARRGRAQEAWQQWEASLARGLCDDLEARRRPLDPGERRSHEDLVEKLDRLDNQIGNLAGTMNPSVQERLRLDELRAERLALERRLTQLESELARKYHVAVGAVYTLDQLQRQLPADAALVGWLDLMNMRQVTDPRRDHWACVVRRTGAPQWIRIMGSGSSQEWIQLDHNLPHDVRRVLRGEGSPTTAEPLLKLAQQRLTPLDAALRARGDLPPVRHFIVLTSPLLQGIPIEALLDALPVSSPPYLVSYAPSGTMYAWFQERRHTEARGASRLRRLLALGDPVPLPPDDPRAPSSRPDEPGLLVQRQALGSSGQTGPPQPRPAPVRRSRGVSFAPLPGSRREVQTIAGLFERSLVYLGSDASEQTLEELRRQGKLAEFDVIHLATHGQIDDLNPVNSRLLLSQDRLPDPAAPLASEGPACDGILSAGEVMNTWKLNAELVTLSACRSGMGRPAGGEGFIGFAQAFFLAGSRSLLVSLWEVDDRATSLLLTRFYQNWLGKRPGLSQPLSKAEALREAKDWLRGLSSADAEREVSQISRGEIRRSIPRPPAGHPFEHPHDWAGFILMGDPN